MKKIFHIGDLFEKCDLEWLYWSEVEIIAISSFIKNFIKGYTSLVSVGITKNTPLQKDFGHLEGGGVLRGFVHPTLKGEDVLRKTFFWGTSPPRPPFYPQI